MSEHQKTYESDMVHHVIAYVGTSTEWVQNCTTPDVVIDVACAGGRGAFFKAETFDTWEPALPVDYEHYVDPTRGGRYLTGGDIWINEQDWNFQPTSLWAGSASHEVGHLYGLADAYLSSGCNPEPTRWQVMDASTTPGGGIINGRCDSSVSTAWDWHYSGSDFFQVDAIQTPPEGDGPYELCLVGMEGRHLGRIVLRSKLLSVEWIRVEFH